MPLYIFNDTDKNIQIPIYFVHIPKCAGTTVEFLFEKKLNLETFLGPNDYIKFRKYLKIPPVHFDISLIEQMFTLEKIYSFASVRNPFDRMLSDYNWAKTNSTEAEFFKKLSFEQFCSYCFDQYHLDNNFMSNHIRPQHKFISSDIDKVFRLEDGLENAIEQVFNDLDLQLSNKFILPKTNTSKYENIKINISTKKKIYNFYEEDFIKFKYEEM